MNTHQQERKALRARLLDYIEHNQGDFDTLALDLFAHQYAHNQPYRRYCDAAAPQASQIDHWTKIPTVPTDVFRFTTLLCGEPSQGAFIFRTSGTTSGRRGEHHLRELGVYHTSALKSIERLLVPDGLERPALMLAPSPQDLPDSSLSSMLGLIAEHHTGNRATFAWSSGQLNIPAAWGWLQDAAARADQPVMVLATSFAMVHLLDADPQTTLALPPNSMVMLTGGTKGRTREISVQDIESMVTERLGVPHHHIVHEYGMTELGSQLYDPRLALWLDNQPLPDTPTFKGPHWCRVTAHDPISLAPLGVGQTGLLRFTDLSNLDSVISIQTSDMGTVLEASPMGDTIVLKGRAPGAVPRGCSLIIEESAWGSS